MERLGMDTHRHRRVAQQSLFCPYGTGTPLVAGRGRRCYQRSADSKRRFGGERDAVPLRDRGWLPPRLIKLWAEQHPGAPLQLQFAWETVA